MRRTLFVLSLLAVMAFPALGASSYLGGLSGALITPNGITVPEKTWEVSYHQLNKFVLDKNLSTAGLTYGFSPNLEVGASYVNGNGSNNVAFNGKYRILNETAGRPPSSPAGISTSTP